MLYSPVDVSDSNVLGGKYRLLDALGRGGMSVVYEAQHVQLGQRFAVKVLNADTKDSPRQFERVLREARVAARLTSEHCVRVLDVGVTSDGHPYVVMEKLAGKDLSHAIASRGSFPVPDAVALVLQACEAIAEAHAAGIVHRDLKPSNLFLVMRPDGLPCVKVLDFGLVHTTAMSGPKAAGSPGYASPEQLGTMGNVDARADVWGLGVVLYELVTGRRAFEASNLSEGLFAVVSQEVPPMQSPSGPLPPGFEAVVKKCLEKDRENRWASVDALADALTPFAPAAFQRYSRRVREVAARGGRLSERTISIMPDSGAPSGAPSASSPESSAGTTADSRSDADGASPLVVAQIVTPGRTALRIGIGAALVAIPLAVFFALRSSAAKTTTQAASSSSTLAAMVSASAQGSSLLPPLPPPSLDPAAAQSATPPGKVAGARSAAAHGAKGPAGPTLGKGTAKGSSGADPMTYR
jgi:serine/threonine-protein kinase